MATVYRSTFTKPLPPDAEVFTRKGERLARWTDRKGRKQTAKVTTTAAGERLLIVAGTFTAKYRTGSGLLVKTATGCRSLDAAKAVLGELTARADRVRSGITTAAEDSVLDHRSTSIAAHAAAYIEHLRGKHGKGGKARVSKVHADNVKRSLDRIMVGCGFGTLRDLNRRAVERWVSTQSKIAPDDGGISARTINAHVAAVTAFGNWCLETSRLTVNPFARIAKQDEKADRRRQRRALTEAELIWLLDAARRRPLAEYGRESEPLPADKRQGRRTWTKADLTPATLAAAEGRARDMLKDHPNRIAELDRIGRKRALTYKVLTLTGLRKAELASLTVGSVEFAGLAGVSYLTLAAADEKAGRGADVPLRRDLADDLRAWLAERLDAARADARAKGDPIPAALPAGAPLLNVPAGLVRILDRDIAAAGIPKRDDRGRTVDVHALRHTFGTHLSKGGIAPRTAQSAMRHSSLEMTMNVYTDPRLLDVAGALDVLPALPLDGGPHVAIATGTDARTLVPTLVPTAGNLSTNGATAGKTTAGDGAAVLAANGLFFPADQRMSTADGMEPTGIEPATPSLQS